MYLYIHEGEYFHSAVIAMSYYLFSMSLDLFCPEDTF